jgi:hypothetical protein
VKLYMSKPGDTLTLIAHKKQLPLQDLLLVNPHWSASEILASGSKVKVPGAAIRIANEETEDEHQHEHRQKLFHVDVEQFFAPYYAYQKRWLEHLERYHSPQHENCQPLAEEKDEHNKQHEHHQHDEVEEEDNTHVPKKRKRSTKLRKRKRKSVKKQRIAPHQHHEVEEQCEDDQVLPWLNV